MGYKLEADWLQQHRGSYVAVLHEFSHLHRGELKLRAMGKEVHKPTGRERVAQLPEEWKNQDLFEGNT